MPRSGMATKLMGREMAYSILIEKADTMCFSIVAAKIKTDWPMKWPSRGLKVRRNPLNYLGLRCD